MDMYGYDWCMDMTVYGYVCCVWLCVGTVYGMYGYDCVWLCMDMTVYGYVWI